MTTAQELIDFAHKHGLYIAPYRDPVKWAEDINTVGEGKCLCNPDRTCPCELAIEEIRAAVEDGRAEEATCACMFYCSKEHYDANLKYAKKVQQRDSVQTSNSDEIAKFLESGVNIREIKHPDVRRVINTLQTVKKMLLDQRPDDAVKELQSAIEGQECELCRDFLKEIVMRIQLAVITCTMGAEVCDQDVLTLYRRINELERLYADVDKELEKDSADIMMERPPSVGYRDAYHQCVSMILSSGIQSELKLSRGDMFTLASKYCAKTASQGKPFSVADAIDYYKNEMAGDSK